MKAQKGFSLVLVLAVAGVLVVGGGVLAFNYFLSSSSASLTSSAFTPTPLDVKVPKTDAETGFKTPAATPAAVPSPTTTTTTTTTTVANISGQVYVTTAISADKKTFTINFKSNDNFLGITSISYNLTYTADSGPRGVQGTFTVSADISPITKALTLGTCSAGGTCVYDANPRNFHLTVSTK